MPKTRLIVDVSNIAYRAAFANSSLSTSSGKFSGHIFGSVASLLAVLRNELKGQEVEIIFCYDGKDSKAYRRSILPEYKDNREHRDLDPLPEVTEVLRLWPGIHIVQNDKEGDDAIAFAVKMLNESPCVIFSGDKDLWSLLQNPNCKVLSPNLKRFVELADVYANYHIKNAPERIPLAKALFGDPSDGIKGVERLIKKQVEPVLNEEGVLTPKDFYNKLGTERPIFISPKMWAKIQENRDRVEKNYCVILPQLDFHKSSVVKVSVESIPLLKQKLIEYECKSLIEGLSIIKT
jgi:5'-3' exonuclease